MRKELENLYSHSRLNIENVYMYFPFLGGIKKRSI